ncbi:SPOR domain-containing protein [Treponema sp.]|uniref:SPOR domain-containing protein n=1 Tax=Treponema sp. TaxID=166 RepID=UPI00257E05CA|nr:SPOR domain-containing protein [Treponema sp.]
MRKIFAIVCTVLFCGLIFTSFSPSLDGRAVVAEDGVMPQGIFARTVGYLPGDSISVTNLAKKTTVDILVIGALDPSEGVAILLSPEAASLLGLEKGGNNVVKITKRSGQLDETVSGTAVIGDSIEQEPAAEETYSAPETSVPAVEDEPEVETVPAMEETSESPEDLISEETPAGEEVEAPLETVSESEPVYSPVEEASVFVPEENTSSEPADDEPFEEITATEEPEVVEKLQETEPFEETVTDEPAEEIESERIDDEFPADEISEETPAEAEVISDEVPAETVYEEQVETSVPDEDCISLEPYSEEIPDGEEADVEKAESDILSDIPAESAVVSETLDVLEESVSPDELSELAPEVVVTEENAQAEELSEEIAEEYEPIVLVPSEPNPPVQKSAVEPEPEVKVLESVPVEAEIASPSAKTGKKPTSDGYNFDKYTVPSLKNLKSGKYYVQIGVYGDKANIKAIIDTYAGKYPVTLVPLASGKATQVLIGPLSVDEYGTVLNRFKSYGYKDAFLRKIK